MGTCKNCGGALKRTYMPRGMGSSTTIYCNCAGLRTVHKHGASTPKKKSSESSRLSIAEQLVVLAGLRFEGSITEQEFQTLKTRLISGGD